MCYQVTLHRQDEKVNQPVKRSLKGVVDFFGLVLRSRNRPSAKNAQHSELQRRACEVFQNPNRPSAKNALAFQAAETVSILIFNLSHSFLPDQRIRIKSSRISEKCSPVNPKSFSL